MLVHEPEVTTADGRVRVSAFVEGEDPHIPSGRKLWYEFDEEFAEGVTTRSDAFAIALCPLGMRLSEDIELRGSVSPLLLSNLRDYQQICKAWWGERANVIEIRADSAKPAPFRESQDSVGTCFSGGVDSFHTLFRRLEPEEPLVAQRVTHAFMVNGFDLDVDLEERGHFRTLRRIYSPILEELNVKRVEVRTNLNAFHRGIPYHTFALNLVPPALVLGRMFRLFYTPSSWAYGYLAPDGSHPMVDHLLGTESLRVVHDGAASSRVAKTASLIDRPETYSTLRVCWTRDWTNVDAVGQTIANCGRCDKCVRTMTSLKLLGALDRYHTFVNPLNRRAIRNARSVGYARWFAEDNLRTAVEVGDRATAFDLRWQMARGRVVGWLEKSEVRLRGLARRVLRRHR